MKKISLLSLLILFSCADSSETIQSSGSDSYDLHDFTEEKFTNQVWICHHPGSEYHNRVCIEESYPDGCYVSGDRSKFCWPLNKSDCSGKLIKEWQIINCPHLKGR